MSSTLDRIIAEVQELAPDERCQLRELLEREAGDTERAQRAARSRTIRGKYAYLGVSSTDFAAQKAAEIALEDRHPARGQSRL